MLRDLREKSFAPRKMVPLSLAWELSLPETELFMSWISHISSMYSICTYIWVIYGGNVGKYSIHGASGFAECTVCFLLGIFPLVNPRHSQTWKIWVSAVGWLRLRALARGWPQLPRSQKPQVLRDLAPKPKTIPERSDLETVLCSVSGDSGDSTKNMGTRSIFIEFGRWVAV